MRRDLATKAQSSAIRLRTTEADDQQLASPFIQAPTGRATRPPTLHQSSRFARLLIREISID
jgi:hypothetical protein